MEPRSDGESQKAGRGSLAVAGRLKKVRFVDKKLFESYWDLKRGRSEEQVLGKDLDFAIERLKVNPFCGVKISRKLWPKKYVSEYGITNLWKYDLPKGWRLVYTIAGDRIEIISILLEWFDHKNYEKRFGYHVK